SVPLASSTVITPSLPTLPKALAIRSPIVSSLFEEMEATCFILSESLPTFWACFSKSATRASTALSIPRFRSMGLAPAATFLRPSLTMAWAKTVAVVVPSPAWSLVLEATSFTIWAPMFSRASSNSISLATVTPSLVTWGAPKDLLMITFLPLGPKVTFTASANLSTPRFRPSRASISNLMSFAIFCLIYLITVMSKIPVGSPSVSGLDDCQNIALPHHQVVGTVEFEFGAGILSIKDGVPDLDGDLFVLGSGAHGHNIAFLGFFLGRVGNDDARGGLGLGLKRLDQHTIRQRSDIYFSHI